MKRSLYLLACVVLFGCADTPSVLPAQDDSLSKKIEAQLPNYPNTLKIYCNDELLKQATLTNSKVVVYLPIQRARFYVCGRIAADWPVSTGRDGHETPSGAFRILDRQDVAMDGNFQLRKKLITQSVVDEVDEYGIPRVMKESIVGSYDVYECGKLPLAMRITWDGVYMYAKPVTHPGVRESGGGVRVPPAMQKKLYSVMKKDSIVYISHASPEPDDRGWVKPEDVKYRSPR